MSFSLPHELSIRVKRIAYFTLVLVSTVSVAGVTFLEYGLFVDMPLSEQLKIPAVMPYDVEQHEAWNVVTGYTVLSLLLVLAVIFVVWNLNLAYRSWRGQEAYVRHEGRVGRFLVTFLLISCFALIGCFLLGFGFLGGIRVGLE